MADQLHAGTQVFTTPATDDTAAAAIERAMNALMSTGPDALSPPPADDTRESRQRRLLFAAIARGVIAHLKAHPEAFEVVFTEVPSNHTISEFGAHVQVKASDV
jgi:hypothetical protein